MTLHLLKRAELSWKEGFSVVAPNSVMVPSSTCGRNASWGKKTRVSQRGRYPQQQLWITVYSTAIRGCAYSFIVLSYTDLSKLSCSDQQTYWKFKLPNYHVHDSVVCKQQHQQQKQNKQATTPPPPPTHTHTLKHVIFTCCNLLKRWISSMKRMVFLLSIILSFLATFTTSFTSLTPQVVAERKVNFVPCLLRATRAMIRARVVWWIGVLSWWKNNHSTIAILYQALWETQLCILYTWVAKPACSGILIMNSTPPFAGKFGNKVLL